MAVKHKNLYLYLALACFLGIILIFIFDGYMGVYDNLTMTSGEFPQTIESDRWPEDEKYPYYSSVGVHPGGSVTFTYEVENRAFSHYSADVEVTVSYEQEQIAVLLSQPLTVSSFDKGQLEWELDTEEILPEDISYEQSYQYIVLIKRGEIERRVIVQIILPPYPTKIPPPLPR